MEISREKVQYKFLKKVEELSGQNLYACYQCGKCSAGCPLTEHMDILPHTVMRFLHLGKSEEILGSETIWFCSSCLQCMAKCPKGIDVAKVMDTLRTVARRQGKNRMELKNMSGKMWEKIPQQAIVSGFRKYTP